MENGNASGIRLALKVCKECLRRAVTPYLMYLIMSMLLLVVQAIKILPLMFILSAICLIGCIFYNAHLLYQTGKLHYGAYVAGELHRENMRLGIPSGGDHRVEREYRIWKGFLIGFFASIPVLIFGAIAGAFPTNGWGNTAYIMFAGWAIIPIRWFFVYGGMDVSSYYSMLMAIVPILVSGVAYIIGARKEKNDRENAELRAEAVREAAKKGK